MFGKKKGVEARDGRVIAPDHTQQVKFFPFFFVFCPRLKLNSRNENIYIKKR